jgi:hypothetical protein
MRGNAASFGTKMLHEARRLPAYRQLGPRIALFNRKRLAATDSPLSARWRALTVCGAAISL